MVAQRMLVAPAMKTKTFALSALASASLIVFVAGCATETAPPVEERTEQSAAAIVKTDPINDRGSCNNSCFDAYEGCVNGCTAGRGFTRCVLARCSLPLDTCLEACSVIFPE